VSNFEQIGLAAPDTEHTGKSGELMFTAAECRAKALEKIFQAKLDRRRRRSLLNAADAWLLLAGRLEAEGATAIEDIPLKKYAGRD
jgi:hypothetical protein